MANSVNSICDLDPIGNEILKKVFLQFDKHFFDNFNITSLVFNNHLYHSKDYNFYLVDKKTSEEFKLKKHTISFFNMLIDYNDIKKIANTLIEEVKVHPVYTKRLLDDSVDEVKKIKKNIHKI